MSLVDIDLEKIFEKRENKYCRFKKFGIKYINYNPTKRIDFDLKRLSYKDS